MTLSTIGTCPVCEGEFCTKNGAMVHHGFERPGHGFIVGDCFAVGMMAYELSAEGCKAYKTEVERRKDSQEAYIARIPTVTHFSKTEKHWRTGEYEKTSFSVFVTEPAKWARLREMEMDEAVRTLEHQVREIARMTKRIADWKPEELRTEKRADVAKAIEVAARKAERLAKKAERDAKAAALQAKRDAKKALQVAAMAELVTKLETLKASDLAPEEKLPRSIQMFSEFFGKKNEKKLGSLTDCYYAFTREEATRNLSVDLGLAVRDASGWVRFPYV